MNATFGKNLERLPTGDQINGQPITDLYGVRTQDVNAFTEVPEWVEESPFPQVGRICGGKFYYLMNRHGLYDAGATRYNAGVVIE